MSALGRPLGEGDQMSVVLPGQRDRGSCDPGAGSGLRAVPDTGMTIEIESASADHRACRRRRRWACMYWWAPLVMVVLAVSAIWVPLAVPATIAIVYMLVTLVAIINHDLHCGEETTYEEAEGY